MNDCSISISCIGEMVWLASSHSVHELVSGTAGMCCDLEALGAGKYDLRTYTGLSRLHQVSQVSGWKVVRRMLALPRMVCHFSWTTPRSAIDQGLGRINISDTVGVGLLALLVRFIPFHLLDFCKPLLVPPLCLVRADDRKGRLRQPRVTAHTARHSFLA